VNERVDPFFWRGIVDPLFKAALIQYGIMNERHVKFLSKGSKNEQLHHNPAHGAARLTQHF